jgi:hypothetical protein
VHSSLFQEVYVYKLDESSRTEKGSLLYLANEGVGDASFFLHF